MILTCPSCETQYFADDTTIGETGRSVKCAACGHTWHVDGSLTPITDRAATTGKAHQAYRQAIREKRERKSRSAAIGAWLMTVLIFIGLIGGALHFRNDVVRIWPQAAGVFRLAGFEVNRFGLDFNSIEPTRTFDGTTPLLTVTGSVVNISRNTQPAAPVRIGLLDDNGIEVAVLTADLDKTKLAPGEEATFSARLENPPVSALDIELYFIEPDGSDATNGQTGGTVDAASEDADPE